MTGLCGDCKFWESHEAWVLADKKSGDCKHPNPMWRTASLDEEALQTPPEFGCVQFEAKEPREATS